jgi:hypothetical protein
MPAGKVSLLKGPLCPVLLLVVGVVSSLIRSPPLVSFNMFSLILDWAGYAFAIL